MAHFKKHGKARLKWPRPWRKCYRVRGVSPKYWADDAPKANTRQRLRQEMIAEWEDSDDRAENSISRGCLQPDNDRADADAAAGPGGVAGGAGAGDMMTEEGFPMLEGERCRRSAKRSTRHNVR